MYTDEELRVTEAEKEALASICKKIHLSNVKAGWWTDLDTGEPKDRNKGEMMMLMVTEIAEAYEGVRKRVPDDHLPQFDMETVELGDTFIRLADYAVGHGARQNLERTDGDLTVACEIAAYRFADIMCHKLSYNKHRADHKPENRRKPGGKKT